MGRSPGRKVITMNEFDVTQTRNKREAKRLQQEGWDLTGISKSIAYGNTFHLKRAKRAKDTRRSLREASLADSFEAINQSKALRLEKALNKVNQRLAKEPSDRLERKKANLQMKLESVQVTPRKGDK